MFSNDLDGVRAFIVASLAGRATTVQAQQFQTTAVGLVAQFVINTYCKERGVAYACPPPSEEGAQSFETIFRALGTIEDIAARFPRQAADPSAGLCAECLATARSPDYFYHVDVNGATTTLWEGLPCGEVLTRLAIPATCPPNPAPSPAAAPAPEPSAVRFI